MSGPPEAAKTLSALIFALESIRRYPVQPVAVIDFESGPGEIRRLLEDLGLTDEELRSVIYFEPDGPPDSQDLRKIVGECISP